MWLKRRHRDLLARAETEHHGDGAHGLHPEELVVSPFGREKPSVHEHDDVEADANNRQDSRIKYAHKSRHQRAYDEPAEPENAHHAANLSGRVTANPAEK